MSADLRRLADALGIAADYEDAWGRRHETGDPVRRALLGAMGIAADSDAAITMHLLRSSATAGYGLCLH
jgi:hypothetical protein